MKSIKTGNRVLFIVILLMAFATPVFADVVVVVHPQNNNKLDEDQVRRIFLGKARAFPDGSKVIPFDQEIGSEERAEFINKVLNKNEGQLNAYWARMLFSSKAIPPKKAGSSEEVKKMIAQTPQSIGYIDVSQVDSTVKVIALLP